MKSIIKRLLREEFNNGRETLCNKMSVATYEEGMRLLIDAIGSPKENPMLWNKIAKPINNWKNADRNIGNEVKRSDMSGDSMVDESNTWWAVIQSTICK